MAPGTRIGALQHMLTALHQHRQQTRAHAATLRRLADAVLADLDHGRAATVDGHQFAVHGRELYAHLREMALIEDLAARMGREEPAA